MRIGTGCPIVNYYWQTGSMKVEFIILQKKLMFCFHLANLPLNSLGRECYDLQVANSLGMVAELQEHLDKIGIVDLTSVNKYQWRKTVRKYIIEANKKSLLESVKQYKKLNYEEFLSEPFSRKSYFYELDLESVRYRFRISSKMVDVRANFPRKYQRSGINCPSCKQLRVVKDKGALSTAPNLCDSTIPAESQSHIMFDCLAFQELRQNYDLSEDSQIVEFFKEALRHRDQFEDEEED